ncbi:UNVERIFIED_CONTAM: hypothetical protein FKN15_038765 [Acipenser sinensis]
MLLVLTDEHKEHLAFLPEVDSAVVGEFGRIALEFLKKGSNSKIYEGAARKLNVAVDTVQHGVEGLMYLLSESSKLMLASRALRQQIKPTVTFKLHLEQNGEESAKVLQTDPATLLHLIQQLEQALGEMKTTHCRRIVRNIK